jgi:hypothetical protein
MPKPSKSETGANLGFEAQLWQAADALRGSMERPSISTLSSA